MAAGGAGSTVHATVSVLLTDVEGSTRWWQQAPEQMAEATARHNALVAEVVTRHQGRLPLEQGEGDSRLAVFTAPWQAVTAAAELQLAFTVEPWPEPVQLAVRMAVHVGDVLLRDDEVMGATLSRTARIRALAHGSQLLVSDAVAAAVHHSLTDDLTLLDLGPHRMRDLVEPERIHQVLHPKLPAAFPPLRSLERVRHNLPRQVSTFIGRDAEVAAVVQAVQQHRLVTLTGFGGMGKTRLALQVAAELADGEGDGVWFVDLAPLTDYRDVPAQIALALSLVDAGHGMAEAVIAHCMDTRMLIVLDNVEQVLEAADFVTHLLSTCPGVRVLATSREPLRLLGERDWRLEPLSLDDDAVALFSDRAAAVRHDFVLDATTAPLVADLCRRLDGMPLALELAAARLRYLPLAAVHQTLDRALPLASHDRDRPARHQTLRATIAWSYDMLMPEERTLLQRLSVFSGAASKSAIDAICAASVEPDEPPLETFGLLSSLIERSLVRPVTADGEPRFSLLVPVREFAREQLSAAELAHLGARHLTHFLELSTIGATRSDSPEAAAWYDELQADLVDLRAALQHARTTGDHQTALVLTANLTELWLELGRLSEGIVLLETLLAAPVADQALRGFSSALLAFLLKQAGQRDRAPAVAADAVEVARASGDLLVLSFALQVASSVAPRASDSVLLGEQCLDVVASIPPGTPVRWGGSRPEAVRIGAGFHLVSLQRWLAPAEGARRADELIEAAREGRRDVDVASLQVLRARFAADRGDADHALSLATTARDAFASLGHERWLVFAEAGVAQALVAAGRYEEAIIALTTVAEQASAAGMASDLTFAQCLIGDCQDGLGHQVLARAAWEQAARGLRVEDHPDVAWRMARAHRRAGENQAAHALLARTWTRLLAHDGLALERADAVGVLIEAALLEDDRAPSLLALAVDLLGDQLAPPPLRAALEDALLRLAPLPPAPAAEPALLA